MKRIKEIFKTFNLNHRMVFKDKALILKQSSILSGGEIKQWDPKMPPVKDIKGKKKVGKKMQLFSILPHLN